MPVTVSLVESSRDLRESFAALLNGTPGLRCVKTYGTAEEALQKIPLDPPDVALMDIHLPGMNSIECVARLKAQLPELQVLMLTMYDESDLIFTSLCAGASGYLSKNASSGEFVEAVVQAQAGGMPVSMSIARKLIDYFHQARPSGSPMEPLAEPEEKILELLARGEYCREFNETPDTGSHMARAHLHSVYRKLHVKSNSETAEKLYR